jgi:hypothetical protein
MQTCLDECSSLCWQHTDDQMDLVALSAKEPIIFYDEVQKQKIIFRECSIFTLVSLKFVGKLNQSNENSLARTGADGFVSVCIVAYLSFHMEYLCSLKLVFLISYRRISSICAYIHTFNIRT